MANYVSQDIFVAPTGADTNRGLAPTEPLRTITEALNRTRNAASTTIRIAAGTYGNLTDLYRFDNPDAQAQVAFVGWDGVGNPGVAFVPVTIRGRWFFTNTALFQNLDLTLSATLTNAQYLLRCSGGTGRAVFQASTKFTAIGSGPGGFIQCTNKAKVRIDGDAANPALINYAASTFTGPLIDLRSMSSFESIDTPVTGSITFVAPPTLSAALAIISLNDQSSCIIYNNLTITGGNATATVLRAVARSYMVVIGDCNINGMGTAVDVYEGGYVYFFRLAGIINNTVGFQARAGGIIEYQKATNPTGLSVSNITRYVSNTQFERIQASEPRAGYLEPQTTPAALVGPVALSPINGLLFDQIPAAYGGAAQSPIASLAITNTDKITFAIARLASYQIIDLNGVGDHWPLNALGRFEIDNGSGVLAIVGTDRPHTKAGAVGTPDPNGQNSQLLVTHLWSSAPIPPGGTITIRCRADLRATAGAQTAYAASTSLVAVGSTCTVRVLDIEAQTLL
jgi:hypothetical protein